MLQLAYQHMKDGACAAPPWLQRVVSLCSACAAVVSECAPHPIPTCPPPTTTVGHLGQGAAWPLKSKAAMLLAAVTRQQGPETFAALLPQLVSCAAEGPLQAEVSCMVLQFVCEDLTQFEERGGEWRRAYLAALLASVDVAVPFAVRLLQVSHSCCCCCCCCCMTAQAATPGMCTRSSAALPAPFFMNLHACSSTSPGRQAP